MTLKGVAHELAIDHISVEKLRISLMWLLGGPCRKDAEHGPKRSSGALF